MTLKISKTAKHSQVGGDLLPVLEGCGWKLVVVEYLMVVEYLGVILSQSGTCGVLLR